MLASQWLLPKQAQVEASPFLAIIPRDGDPVMSVDKVPRTLHPYSQETPP